MFSSLGCISLCKHPQSKYTLTWTCAFRVHGVTWNIRDHTLTNTPTQNSIPCPDAGKCVSHEVQSHWSMCLRIFFKLFAHFPSPVKLNCCHGQEEMPPPSICLDVRLWSPVQSPVVWMLSETSSFNVSLLAVNLVPGSLPSHDS